MPTENPSQPLHQTVYKRYWTIGYAFPGESNRIHEVSEASGLRIVGLVDEEAGGVIGYLAAGHETNILDALDSSEDPSPSAVADALDWLYDELIEIEQCPRDALRICDRLETKLTERN